MEIQDALEIWRGSAYKRINGYLLQNVIDSLPIEPIDKQKKLRAVRLYIGAQPPADYDVEEVVKALRNGMKLIDTSIHYYRGDTRKRQLNCRIETFLSITKNKEDAKAFTDDGLLYEITLINGVRGLQTGTEGEIVLEDGCFWEFKGNNKVTIHPPSAELGYPWSINLIQYGGRKKYTHTRKHTRKSSQTKKYKHKYKKINIRK